jgi:phosphate transport system substrate-binding protein
LVDEEPELYQHKPKRRGASCIATLLVGLAGRFSAAPGLVCAQEGPLRVGGTGSAVGGVQLVAQAFMRIQPEAKVVVLPVVGSTGGIQALAAGKLDLALTYREPSAEEQAAVPLVSLEYAITPFVLAVHRDIGLRSATSAQVAAMYEPGALYPNGQRTRPVIRRSDAADTAQVKAFSPLIDRAVTQAGARRGMLDAATDADAANYVQNTPGAFGATTLAQIESEGRPLVALVIDGREPTLDNLASGVYPHHKRLFAITRAQPSAAVARFLAYLRSPPAKALLRAHGHLPL